MFSWLYSHSEHTKLFSNVYPAAFTFIIKKQKPLPRNPNSPKLPHSENLPPDYQLTLEVYCMSYNMYSSATPAKKKKLETNTPKRLLQNALHKMGASQVGL